MLVKIIETIATSKSQRTYEAKLARALKLLRKKRHEGNPDRLREEDVLRGFNPLIVGAHIQTVIHDAVHDHIDMVSIPS